MALTKVDIFNLALSAAGADHNVSSVDQKTRPAELCKLHYDQVLEHILRAAHWSCAKTSTALALAKTRSSSTWAEGDPEPGWTYAYNLPSNHLWPRFLSTYERFSLGHITDRTYFQTNAETPVLIYTFKQDNVAMWDSGLVNAVTFALAARISRPLSGGKAMTNDLYAQANRAILEAREMAANEDDSMVEHIPDWLVARGAFTGPLVNRYVYPAGPLFIAGT